MVTLKKKHNISDPILDELIKKFNNVVRFAYNRRVKDGVTNLAELEKLVKTKMKNIEILDASWIKCAVKKSTELQIENKLYFGGKYNFFKKKYGKKVDFNKNSPLEMRGSSSDGGNRKAYLNGNTLMFKPFKGIKLEIVLNLSKNEQRMLDIIQEKCKTKTGYFNFEINNEFIWISFNEPKMVEFHDFKKDRILGIDLNPNWIALSIMDFGTKEIYKELVDLRELNKFSKSKKEYELSILNKRIIGLCKQYNVEMVCLEDLNIRSSNKGLGKRHNRLVNNDWNRNYFVNNLIKWLNISDIKHLMVNPFYTSFMGQIKNTEDYDSVAASKEVAFRGYLMIKGVKVNDYVKDHLSSLVSTHWKEMKPNVNTYRDLYNYFKTQKKSKNSYRFLFNDVEKQRWSSFRLKSFKSRIDLIMI